MPAAGQQRVNHVITVVLVLIFVLILLVGIGLSLHHPGWLILYGLAVAPTFTAILVGVHLGLGGTSSPNGVQVGGAAKSPVGLVLKIVGGALFALMASAVMIVVGFLLAISTLIATINVCLKTLTGAGG